MKRIFKVLSLALATLAVATTSSPTFAVEFSKGVVNARIDAGIQPRTSVGVQHFKVSGQPLYLNVDNSAHPNSVAANDTVIIWNYTSGSDQKWNLWYGGSGGYYFRHSLNLNLAMNINHAQNKCTLFNPVNNMTQGKSDSDIYMNGSKLQLSAWGYQLTNSILQPGYACYWTSNGTDYLSLPG